MTAQTFQDDEVASFRAEIRRWLEDAVPPRWRSDRAGMAPDEIRAVQQDWDRVLQSAGYAGLAWPAEYGGRGLGPIEELVYYQESARAGAPEGFGRIGRVLAGPTIIACGSPDQQARFLPPILDGSEIWCQGFSEPAAGSDLAAVATTAVRTADGGYRVTGQKIWTSFAQYSRRCLMLARTSDGPRHRNLSFFLLDMDQPGIEVRPIEQISGDDEFSEVFFDGAYVAEADRVGEEGAGWQVAMTVLTNERGTIEAGTRLIEIAADLDVLLACCATGAHRAGAEGIARSTELLRWHVLRATEEKASGADWFRSGSTLKVVWSELMQECSRYGVGIGCVRHRDYWRHRYLASRAVSIYSGTNEIQRNIIADRVLQIPR